MPVLIDSDWAFWGLAVALGITSGYYSSLAMMYCPRWVCGGLGEIWLRYNCGPGLLLPVFLCFHVKVYMYLYLPNFFVCGNI